MLNIEKYKEELKKCKMREECKEVESGFCFSNPCSACREDNIEWLCSEYKEPILDEAEKEYLSAVIEPFRKSVISIKKLEATYGWEIISFYSQNSQSCGCITILPPFESGTRFKGMKAGKEYTLEELGL